MVDVFQESQFLPLSEAAKEFGVSQNYLRFLIFKKKLRGAKIGRNWTTTAEWMDEYFKRHKEPQLSEKNDTVESASKIFSVLPVKSKWVEMELDHPNSNVTPQLSSAVIALPLLLIISYAVAASFGFAPYELAGVLMKDGFKFASEDLFHNEKIILSETKNLELAKFADFIKSFTNSSLNLPTLQFPKLSDLSFSKISLPSFSLPPLPSLTSLLHELLAPLEIGRLKMVVKSLMGFHSPPSSTSEIPIPRKPQIATDSNRDTHGKKSYEVESRFSGIQPREDSLVIASEAKQTQSYELSISSQLFSSLATLNQKLREEFFQTTNDLNNRISTLGDKQTSQSRIITLTQKIDQLSNATFSNATFNGTANQFNLRDTDIPDDITVTGAISPSQLTVSNTLTVSGTGTSTYSGGIQAKALNITSTTATSTFSNGIQLGGGCFKNSQGDCLTSTTPGGSNSQIQFNSSGTFSADSNLVWDNTAKRLGIGTSTPGSLLSIQGGNLQVTGTTTASSIIATSTLFVGSTGNLFSVFQNGNVGIGTTSPAQLLSVQGNSLISGTSTVGSLIATSTLFVGSSGNFLNVLQNGFVGIGTTSPSQLLSVQGNTLLAGTTTVNSLIATSTLFVGSIGQFFNVFQNGFVGIGTTSPSSLLSVHGNTLISGTTTVNSLIATSTLFVGSSGNLFNVMQNGFVGIGTTSPSQLLSVQGNTLLAGTTTVNSLIATSTLFVGSIGQFFNVLQNGFVGIGTTSPSSLLSVHGNTLISGTTTVNSLIATSTLFVGSSGNLFNVMQNGFVGIGTTSPSSTLSIQGIANFVQGATSTLYSILRFPNFISTSTTATSSLAGSLYVASSTPGGNALFAVGTSTSGGALLWVDKNSGNVGIGTTSPGSLFSINNVVNFVPNSTSTIYSGLYVASTTATSTFANGIKLNNGGIQFPDNTTQTSATVTIRKTSDETVTNNTLQNDDELFLAMAANETWFFDVYLTFSSNATADIQFTFTIPTGATLNWSCGGARLDTALAVNRCGTITTSGTSLSWGVEDTSSQSARLSGVVINGGTAGNLQLQWAQNTTTAVDTKVLANSYLEAHK